MSWDNPQDRSLALREYTERYCDGTLSAEQTAELERNLRDDPSALDAFVLYMEVHSRIAWNARAHAEDEHDRPPDANQRQGMVGSPAIDVSVDLEPQTPEPPFPTLSTTSYPLPTAPFVGSWAFSYMVATVIMGVAILGFWAYKITHHQHIAEAPSQSAPSDARQEMVFVGRITGMVDVKWSDDPRYLPPPGFAHVSLGRKYILDSGLLEITYDSGAKVILEGPCTYEVESTAGGYLALGKLTARIEERREKREEGARTADSTSSLIPHPSSLFSVRTPTAVVTDLGTEFGVEVDKSGGSKTHVFQGKVEVRLSGDKTDARAIRLGVGESARVERAEDTEQMSIIRYAAGKTSSGFVRAMPRPKPAETVRIVETFDGAELGAAFDQMPPDRYAIRHGAAEYPRQEPLTPQGRQSRGYIRTVATDFLYRDFVFEATFQVRLDAFEQTIHHQILFGIGDGVPNANFYDVVTCGLVLSFVVDNGQALVRRYDPDSDSKRVIFRNAGGTVTEAVPLGGLSPGRHRFRLTKTGRCVKFAVDANFKGEFQQDFISRPIDLPTAAPLLDATNSRLLVGTGNCNTMTVRFEELSVTYLKTPEKGIDANEPKDEGGETMNDP